MKKFGIFLSCALAVGLWSCSEDKGPKGGVEDDAAGVYATIQLNFNSRSATVDPGDNPAQSDAGFEWGKDRENNVSAVLVVLASSVTDAEGKITYKYITSSGVANAYNTENSINGTAGQPNPIYRVKFQTSALVTYAGQDVCVFAYCNPSPELAKKIAEGKWDVDLTESILSADNDAIWTANSFLMTSALPASKTLPTEAEMNNTYNRVQNPFNLGTVKVERVAARFDYAMTTVVNGKNLDRANRFPIYDYVPEEEDNLQKDKETHDYENGEGPVKPTIQGYVEITDLALINEAKNFYLLPRVASGNENNTAADMDNITVLGQETPLNWVISPTMQEYFYQLTGEFDPLEDVFFTNVYTINEACNTEDWIPGNEDYKIWRYTTENTIPSVAAQKRGISTGVIFRGEIIGVEGSDLAASIASGANSGKALYVHDGIMYGDLDHLLAYISKNPRSGVSIDFQATLDITLDLSVLTTPELILSYLESHNIGDLNGSTPLFSVYKPDGGKYYVYYYYYNRHNDNHNNTQMGPMEFATVRNNVYKLQITNILKWGKPADQPDDSTDDDENPEVYFRVQVEVLPWVVRVNNIEF